jgi:hypothetical protein
VKPTEEEKQYTNPEGVELIIILIFNPFRIEDFLQFFATGFTGGYSDLTPLGY